MGLIFIELWSMNNKWSAADSNERQAFMDNLGPTIQSFVDRGLDIVAWGYNNNHVPKRASYDVFAVYRIPTPRLQEELFSAIEASGWYEYFDHVNVSGEARDPSEIMRDHVNSGREKGPDTFNWKI